MENKELKQLMDKVTSLEKTVETMPLLEFSKNGFKPADIRTILGSLDNNHYSKINKVVSAKAKQ